MLIFFTSFLLLLSVYLLYMFYFVFFWNSILYIIFGFLLIVWFVCICLKENEEKKFIFLHQIINFRVIFHTFPINRWISEDIGGKCDMILLFSYCYFLSTHNVMYSSPGYFSYAWHYIFPIASSFLGQKFSWSLSFVDNFLTGEYVVAGPAPLYVLNNLTCCVQRAQSQDLPFCFILFFDVFLRAL